MATNVVCLGFCNLSAFERIFPKQITWLGSAEGIDIKILVSECFQLPLWQCLKWEISDILRPHPNQLLVCYRHFSLFAENQSQRGVSGILLHSGQVLTFCQHQAHPRSKLWRIFFLCCPEPPSRLSTVLGRESGWHACKPQWPTSKCITRVPHSGGGWCHCLAGGEGQASAIRLMSFLQIHSHK